MSHGSSARGRQRRRPILRRQSDAKKRAANRVRFIQCRKPVRDLVAHDGTTGGAIAAADALRNDHLFVAEPRFPHEIPRRWAASDSHNNWTSGRGERRDDPQAPPCRRRQEYRLQDPLDALVIGAMRPESELMGYATMAAAREVTLDPRDVRPQVGIGIGIACQVVDRTGPTILGALRQADHAPSSPDDYAAGPGMINDRPLFSARSAIRPLLNRSSSRVS